MSDIAPMVGGMETPAPTYDLVGPILDGIGRAPGLLFESMQQNPGPWLIFAGVIVLKMIEVRVSGRRRGRRR